MSADGPMVPRAARAQSCFTPLATEYGLDPQEPRCWSREAQVSFASDAVLLRIHLGVGCDPYVTVGAVGKEQFGLRQIVGDREPEREPELLSAPGEPESTLLDRLAGLAGRLATDLLSGDFSAIPRLRRVRARQTREDHKRDFGTSTGETPRFDHRPALQELFADASNEGIGDARVYQGFWDYEYSLAELALFLDCSEAEVQARLDRWDGI